MAKESEHALAGLADTLKAQVTKLPERIEKLLEENKQLVQELKEAKKAALAGKVQELVANVEKGHKHAVLAAQVQMSVEDVKACAEEALLALASGVVALGTVVDDKCHVIIRVSDDLVQKGVKAGDLVKGIAPIIEGSGGGKPGSAQAGGKCPERLPEALLAVRQLVQSAE